MACIMILTCLEMGAFPHADALGPLSHLLIYRQCFQLSMSGVLSMFGLRVCGHVRAG